MQTIFKKEIILHIVRLVWVAAFGYLTLCGLHSAQEDPKNMTGSKDPLSEKIVPALPDYVPSIVTGDIQKGIEKHIAEEVIKGNGYFCTSFEGTELKLKLVRVHVEYLASLAPQRHFACVDMAASDGEFYDIDFFLNGVADAMTVSETTVHKKNGQPYYVWEQDKDKYWVRTPVKDADKKLLGIRLGEDSFEFRYQATLPPITGKARLWIPIAASNNFQKVNTKSISCPGSYKILVDTAHKNQVLYMEPAPEEGEQTLEIVYEVSRIEQSAKPGNREEAIKHLTPEIKVPADEKIHEIAVKQTKTHKDDLMRARALYDYVIDQMKYKRCGEGWGQGDAVRACDVKSGNCTDFHSLFIGLARSIGIPARFIIGAAIPSERDNGGTDGYHCWAEFYAEGQWYPVDLSEANKFSALSMYYFGHAPANRFEFTHGRDLLLDPGPASGPINFLAYPLLEVDEKPVKVKTLFLFHRKAD